MCHHFLSEACPGEPHQPAAPVRAEPDILATLAWGFPANCSPPQLLIPWVRNHKNRPFQDRDAHHVLLAITLPRPSHWPDTKRSRSRRKRANPHPPTGLEIKLPWSVKAAMP
jgi:hypothetical protein